MSRFVAASVAVALAVLPAAARADLFSSVSVGAHAGTTGYGVSLERPLLFDFSVRVQTGTMSVSQQLSYDGNPYTTTTRYNDLALIADYHPHAGRWRISGGLVFGNDNVQNVARTEGPTLRIGNGLYSAAGAGTVISRVRYDRPSIYAGVGTGAGLIKGLALTLDAGVLIRNGTTSASASGPLSNDPAFRADLYRLQNEQRTHVVVPALSIGLVYRP
ncbi:MAG TPA: hypothetical protein VHT53_05760 [Candidatus Elarobacter sp.]|jgi:hypothetical protein|nr:hypothetical protein [Candidatus Elarobacter sp.]